MTSALASAKGLPHSAVMSLARSSLWELTNLSKLFSFIPFSLAGKSAHMLKLPLATLIAFSASSGVESWAMPMTLSLTGFVTWNVFPEEAATHSPPMKFLSLKRLKYRQPADRLPLHCRWNA